MKLKKISKTLDTKFIKKYHTEDEHFSLRNSQYLTRSRYLRKINILNCLFVVSIVFNYTCHFLNKLDHIDTTQLDV